MADLDLKRDRAIAKHWRNHRDATIEQAGSTLIGYIDAYERLTRELGECTGALDTGGKLVADNLRLTRERDDAQFERDNYKDAWLSANGLLQATTETEKKLRARLRECEEYRKALDLDEGEKPSATQVQDLRKRVADMKHLPREVAFLRQQMIGWREIARGAQASLAITQAARDEAAWEEAQKALAAPADEVLAPVSKSQAKRLTAQSGWVSVDARLPNPGREYEVKARALYIRHSRGDYWKSFPTHWRALAAPAAQDPSGIPTTEDAP